MKFISFYYLIFIFTVLAVYYVIPGRFRYMCLLLFNFLYYFLCVRDIKCLLPIMVVIIMTWSGAGLINACNTDYKRKLIMFFTVTVCLVGLFYFRFSLALLGISFYTLQAFSYMFEVYGRRIVPERNLFLYAAYVTFFPTILSGPIERPENLLLQLKKLSEKRFDFEDFRNGLTLILYGAFLKYVIADRIASIVDTVFNYYGEYGFFLLMFGAICYSIQIYCDFSAYSLSALGVGKIMRINVMENFRAPYFSGSVQEFWRRWHISLSTWFRDYIYIPLGGNRCSLVRTNINLLITFLVSGIWHGAGITFFLWGMLHGLYQIVGRATLKIRERIYRWAHVKKNCFSFWLGQRICTFLLIAFAWIFFRAGTVGEALRYIKRMFTFYDIWKLFDGTLYTLGLNILEMNILMVSLVFLFVVDYIKYKKNINIDIILLEQNFLFRVMIVLYLFFMTFVFGVYGPGFNAQEFIYFQF